MDKCPWIPKIVQLAALQFERSSPFPLTVLLPSFQPFEVLFHLAVDSVTGSLALSALADLALSPFLSVWRVCFPGS